MSDLPRLSPKDRNILEQLIGRETGPRAELVADSDGVLSRNAIYVYLSRMEDRGLIEGREAPTPKGESGPPRQDLTGSQATVVECSPPTRMVARDVGAAMTRRHRIWTLRAIIAAVPVGGLIVYGQVAGVSPFGILGLFCALGFGLGVLGAGWDRRRRIRRAERQELMNQAWRSQRSQACDHRSRTSQMSATNAMRRGRSFPATLAIQ